MFSQTLCKRENPKPGQFGRVMAQEIMINNPAIANLIREGKTAQLYSQIQTGGDLGDADPGAGPGKPRAGRGDQSWPRRWPKLENRVNSTVCWAMTEAA